MSSNFTDDSSVWSMEFATDCEVYLFCGMGMNLITITFNPLRFATHKKMKICIIIVYIMLIDIKCTLD